MFLKTNEDFVSKNIDHYTSNTVSHHLNAFLKEAIKLMSVTTQINAKI